MIEPEIPVNNHILRMAKAWARDNGYSLVRDDLKVYGAGYEQGYKDGHAAAEIQALDKQQRERFGLTADQLKEYLSE